MTYVPALTDGAATLATGAPSDIYGGRGVHVSRGHDLDVTKMRGYRRGPGREMAHRPGAHSPKVDRVVVGREAPWWVGSQISRDALGKMRMDWENNGPVGTRHAYTAPPPAGLNRKSRLRMIETPAMGVFRSALAGTGGMMRLGGSFTAPAGYVDPGQRNMLMPLPPAPLPVQSVAPGMQPVGCLPGTPGCFASPAGYVAPGQRAPWGVVQNQGQMQAMAQAPSMLSPLPGGGNTVQEVALPISHPGLVHVVSETTGNSYVESPDYPSYDSPWGYQGGSRVGAPQPVESGIDAITPVIGGGSVSMLKKIAPAAVAIGAALLFLGKKRRR